MASSLTRVLFVVLVFITLSSALSITNVTFTSNYPAGQSFVCHPFVPCVVNCADYNSCYQSNINASLATSLTLTCSGQGSCQQSNLTCPSNGPCTITCSSYAACYQSTVVGGQVAFISPLSLTCAAQASCQELQLSVGHSLGAVTIHCYDDSSCHRASFFTPYALDTYLTCDAQKSCQEVALTCPHKGVCNVFCSSADSSCYGASYFATLSREFSIDCQGQIACHSSKFACPLNGICSLNCPGESSCYAINLVASDLCLNCSGKTSCQTAALAADGFTHVECIGDHACDGIVETNLQGEEKKVNKEKDFVCPNNWNNGIVNAARAKYVTAAVNKL